MVLIAPYEKNPKLWSEIQWTNRYSGRTYRLSVEPSGGWERPGVVTPKTYRDVLTDYRAHPEAKSNGPNAVACGAETAGLLQRRPVTGRRPVHIGKEANQLEDAITGLIADSDEILNNYDDDPAASQLRDALPVLRELGPREVARRTGHSLGAVHAVLSGQSTPRPAALSRYLMVANETRGPEESQPSLRDDQRTDVRGDGEG